MKQIGRAIIAIICLSALTLYLTGCSSRDVDNSPKINEFIVITSLKEIKKNQYEVEYELKKDLEKGSGQTTQNLYFNDGKTNVPLVSEKKGKQKITIKGKGIKLIYNASNRYIEEIKLN